MSHKTWIIKYRDTMEKPDWDGYNGKPITKATTENALRLLTTFQKKLMK